MKLTARQVDTSKPKDKPYKLSDGGGLYLLVNPNGSRYWRLKYRIAGKEKLLALGVYPDITLAEARQKRADAKKVLAAGGDPGQEKQEEKQAKEQAVANSFERLAMEWHSHKSTSWSEGYAEHLLMYLKKDIFPFIGQKAITDISQVEMLNVLRKMEQRGVLDKLKKTRQACRQIFTYAIITGRAEHNPVSDLAGALAGSLGVAPTANIDPERRFPSMFEPIHGSAFDITGKGIANPIATFWTAVQMLEHLGERHAAALIMESIEYVCEKGILTPDVGGSANTAEVTRAVVHYIDAKADIAETA